MTNQTSPLWKHAYANILKISPPRNKKNAEKIFYIFHTSAQNIECGYSLEPPHRGSSNEYSQSMFWAEIMHTPVSHVYHIKVGFKGVKRYVFVMIILICESQCVVSEKPFKRRSRLRNTSYPLPFCKTTRKNNVQLSSLENCFSINTNSNGSSIFWIKKIFVDKGCASYRGLIIAFVWKCTFVNATLRASIIIIIIIITIIILKTYSHDGACTLVWNSSLINTNLPASIIILNRFTWWSLHFCMHIKHSLQVILFVHMSIFMTPNSSFIVKENIMLLFLKLCSLLSRYLDWLPKNISYTLNSTCS